MKSLSLKTVLPLLIFTTLFLSACDRQEETPAKKTETPDKMKVQPPASPAGPIVVVRTSETRSIQPAFQYPATIEAVESAAMHPQVAGVVKSRNVIPGGSVKKGELLMELDDADYRVKVLEIKATLAQAQASAAEAAANFERAGKLKDKGYISIKDYDTAKAKNLSANAQIDQVRAQLQHAELNLARTRIFAPFSGKISAAHYAVGDYVTPASPQPLFELAKTDSVYAVANVNMRIYEDFILKRAKLREQGKEIPPLELHLKLASGNMYPMPGTFVNWDNTATGSTGTIAGRALFDNPDSLLLPGHNVTILGRVIDPVDRIMVPQKSVSQDQQGHYVLIVNDSSVVERRNVEVGIREGLDWAVPDGLEEGDRVIVEGLQKVRPGIKVTVKQGQALK